MGRKRLPEGEKLEILTVQLEGKYLKGQDKDILRAVARKSILEYVDLSQTKKLS